MRSSTSQMDKSSATIFDSQRPLFKIPSKTRKPRENTYLVLQKNGHLLLITPCYLNQSSILHRTKESDTEPAIDA